LTNGFNDNITFNFSSPLNLERITNLFQSLEDSLYRELAEISPLFERQPQSNAETWMKLKGISHATPNDMLRLSKNQMLLPDLLIMDSTSEASRVLLDESHMDLLSELLAIFTYHLLIPFRMAKNASIETPINWGIFAKHSINASTFFVDGSCSNQKIMPILAGFGVFIPHQLNNNVSTSISFCSRIPGMQTIERAEAFAVLVALLLSTDTGPITIYSDCRKLVNTVNRYKLIPPKPHEVIKLHDRSLILRILNEIQFRRFPTSLEFLRNHVRLEKPLKNDRDVNDERLQSCIKYGKQADKKARASLSLTNISIPDETQFRKQSRLVYLFIHPSMTLLQKACYQTYITLKVTQQNCMMAFSKERNNIIFVKVIGTNICLHHLYGKEHRFLSCIQNGV
jgi:ribonuclease HI